MNPKFHDRLQVWKKTFHRFGFKATSGVVLHDIFGRILPHYVVDVFCLEASTLRQSEFPPLPAGYTARWVSLSEVEARVETCEDPTLAEFLAEEHEVEMECFAILDEKDRFANYCWYSNQPVIFVGDHDLKVYFPDHFTYGFKGFTRSSDRGKRLQVYSLTSAVLSGHMQRDKLLALISTFNHGSLRYAKYQGFRRIGRILILCWGKHCTMLHSPSLLRQGIRVVKGNGATL